MYREGLQNVLPLFNLALYRMIHMLLKSTFFRQFINATFANFSVNISEMKHATLYFDTEILPIKIDLKQLGLCHTS
jgi:hypothetical protein